MLEMCSDEPTEEPEETSYPSSTPTTSTPTPGEGDCTNKDEVLLIVTVKTDKKVKKDKTQWKIEGKRKRWNKPPRITLLGKGNLSKKKNKKVELYNECVV